MRVRRPRTSCYRRVSSNSRRPIVRTHRWEYAPGIFASVSASGNGASQRSGRHSPPSGPQSAGLVFAAWIGKNTSVPSGTKMECMSVPSVPRTGLESGRVLSARALWGWEC